MTWRALTEVKSAGDTSLRRSMRIIQGPSISLVRPLLALISTSRRQQPTSKHPESLVSAT